MINIKKFFNLTFYISELDQFLKHFDRTHPHLSRSQQQEIKKYQRLYSLRDEAKPSNQHEKHPAEFLE